MFRALLVISVGSFTMAVIALQALEIPGGYFELATVATLITAAITAVVYFAVRLTARTWRSKFRRRARRVFRFHRVLGATRRGVPAGLSSNSLRHR